MITQAAPRGWHTNPNKRAAFLWWDGTRWASDDPRISRLASRTCVE